MINGVYKSRSSSCCPALIFNCCCLVIFERFLNLEIMILVEFMACNFQLWCFGAFFAIF
jgi:hypothetical protein